MVFKKIVYHKLLKPENMAQQCSEQSSPLNDKE